MDISNLFDVYNQSKSKGHRAKTWLFRSESLKELLEAGVKLKEDVPEPSTVANLAGVPIVIDEFLPPELFAALDTDKGWITLGMDGTITLRISHNEAP